jgi:hypothetical protein
LKGRDLLEDLSGLWWDVTLKFIIKTRFEEVGVRWWAVVNTIMNLLSFFTT